jgi:hypothetical protein
MASATGRPKTPQAASSPEAIGRDARIARGAAFLSGKPLIAYPRLYRLGACSNRRATLREGDVSSSERKLAPGFTIRGLTPQACEKASVS